MSQSTAIFLTEPAAEQDTVAIQIDEVSDNSETENQQNYSENIDDDDNLKYNIKKPFLR